MPKALLLFSGGLDSLLAARILQSQGVEVEALIFVSPFFKNERAIKRAKEEGIPFRIVDFTQTIFELLKNPPHGFGKGMNPCIDCKINMLKKALPLLKETGADFIATGEVLGQRPMTQNRRTLLLIEKEAGAQGKVVRPLSAKLLPKTEAEKKGFIERKKLYAIAGRGRKKQFELAEKFGIKNIPSPAGGCLLTDPIFSKRLKDLMEHEGLSIWGVELLKAGRHFRTPEGERVVVSRKPSEREVLEKLAALQSLWFIRPFGEGEVGLLVGKNLEIAAKIIGAYCKYGEIAFLAKRGKEETVVRTTPYTKEEVSEFLIK